MTVEPGTRLGPYEVLGALGAGGMGEVYRARDTKLGRDVAIKVLPPEIAFSERRRARFEREARAASALNHPNIVTIHDFGQAEALSYLVMECVEGKTLRELLALGPLATRRMLQIAAQVADGLAKAHAAGIVHRDLKPENIMVTGDGIAKVLDFGLAKHAAAPEEDTEAPTVSRQTEPGMVVGTVGYMSPEQAAGRSVDFRSDQFSLGAILYEIATGRRAFQGASAAETLAAVLRDEPRPIAGVNPEVPAPFQWIVERCLAKEPEERYAATQDLARELQMLRDRLPRSQVSSGVEIGGTLARPRRRFRRAGGFAVGAVVLLAVAGLWWTRSRPKPSLGPATSASIAVLPFQVFGGATEDEYLADGMTEAIITELARIRDLTVIARNSSFQYKGKSVDVKKVGADLRVGYVLEGSLQRSSDRLRVHAQLIDVATGTHRWAERYDREMRDIFAVQDDIAKDIGVALELALGSARTSRAGSPPTQNLEAYDAYLRGRFLLDKEDQAEFQRGIGMVERAVALDPQFPLAHAVLALAYAENFFSEPAKKDWEEKAGVEIQKALALDPSQADAYLARGRLAWTLPNGFPHEAAIKDYRRALEINPNNADAHQLLGLVYSHIGLLDEAIEAYKRALRLNPHQVYSQDFIAWTLLLQHQYEGVMAEYERNPQMTFMTGLAKLPAMIYLGREREVLPLVEEALAKRKGSNLVSLRAILLARAGDWKRAEEEIAEAVPLGQGQNHFHHTEHYIASAYSLMGKKQQALEWLEKAAAHGFPCYPYFEKDPHLDALRSESEFQAFMRRLKAQWERLRASSKATP